MQLQCTTVGSMPDSCLIATKSQWASLRRSVSLQANNTATNENLSGFAPSAIILLNTSRASRPHPCCASPLIITVHVIASRPVILSKTSRATSILQNFPYKQMSALPTRKSDLSPLQGHCCKLHPLANPLHSQLDPGCWSKRLHLS